MTDGIHKVDAILDGWFGESLEQSESERQLRKHLYEPLRKLVDDLEQHNGFVRKRCRRYRKKAAAANNAISGHMLNAWRERQSRRVLEQRIGMLSPAQRAIFGIAA